MAILSSASRAPGAAGPATGRPVPARPPAAGPVLEVRGLVKRYGTAAALSGFTLTVQAGEIAGLVGPSGAGKTTVINVVTGLVRADAGRVRVAGINAIRHSRQARRLIGVLPQDQGLYPAATVAGNLRLSGRLAGLRGRELAAAVDAVAAELLPGGMLGLRAGRLSGGQRRLAQAAVALLGTPRLLLLDGPTAGADPETRAALLAAVRRRAAAGAAVLYTTHCLCELADLGATLTVAHQGRVIARGTPGSLLRGLPGELRLRFAAGADTRMLPAALAARARTIGGETRIASTDPAGDLGAVVAAGCAPVTVDVRRPGIDDLYRAIAAAAPRAA